MLTDDGYRWQGEHRKKKRRMKEQNAQCPWGGRRGAEQLQSLGGS